MSGEKRYRSIVKAFSWRATGTADTILISYLITKKFDWALSIGLVELFTKMFLYYFHERLWNKLSFGKAPEKQDYQI